MNKQGIVIIPSWYPGPTDPLAGIFVRQQARALLAAGLNISVFALVESRLPVWGGRSGSYFGVEAGIPTYRLEAFTPPKRIRWLRFWWLSHWDRLMEAYRDHNGGLPRLLHAHSFVGGAAAKYLSKKYGIPYLVTEHYSGFRGGAIPAYWEKDLSSIYGAASRVIAVSPALATGMSAYVSEVKVIPNMIDTGLFRPNEEPFDPSETSRIISVGSLIPRKNQELLLRVFAQLKGNFPLALTIIGDGPLRSKLLRLARKLGVEECVDLTGSLSPREVAARLRSAQLYVSTSRSESFALAPVEALACGLPVVMMRCGSILESVQLKGVLVIDQETKLKAGIIQQLEKLDRIRQLDRFRQVEAVFGPSVIVAQLQAIYGEI